MSVVSEIALIDAIECVAENLSKKLSKDERDALEFLLDALDESGAIDRRTEEKIRWWAWVHPSRLIGLFEKGLRSGGDRDCPVEFRAGNTDEQNVGRLWGHVRV